MTDAYPPSTPPSSGWRDRLSQALAEPFLVLRRFLNGPLLRLNAPLIARADQQLAELRGLSERLEALTTMADRRLDALASRADHIQQRVDGFSLRFDQLQERVDTLPPRFDVLQDRLDATPARFDALQTRVDEIPGRIDGVQARVEQGREDVRQLGEGLDGFVSRQDDHATAQRYVARHAAENARRTVAALGRTEAVLDRFSARFDELEIKSRPLIAYDEESWAVRLREGYALVPRADPVFATAVANASSGGLEPGVRRVLHALIEPGMGVADVGANVGLLTLACAFATGPGGQVWSFEPEAGPRAQLAKTLHLNGLSWVTVSDRAVGAAEGRARFHVSPTLGHSSLHPLPDDEQAQARTIEVEVTTLDQALPPGQRLDVVKIDVEGAELDVLAGMTRLLAENGDIALIAEYGPSHLERLGGSRESWFAAFAAHGFEAWLIGEPFGACLPVASDPALLDGAYSANIAFVRPGGAALARLPRA